MRGTIVSSSSESIVVNTGSDNETIAFGPHVRLAGLVARQVAPGDFIRTTVVPQPDGSVKAMKVHIFPAALKGTGEGYHPWDRQQKSMMANATVQRVGSGNAGRTLLLAYKGGTKTVIIAPNIPVVAIELGTKSLLTSGAHVFIIATRTANGLVARAINVRRRWNCPTDVAALRCGKPP